MVPPKIWLAINISLGIVIMFLVLSLAGVTFPTVGQAKYLLDPDEPQFGVGGIEGLQPGGNLNRFCLEARMQGSCYKQAGDFDWVCGEKIRYWMNNKAYYYCIQQRFW